MAGKDQTTAFTKTKSFTSRYTITFKWLTPGSYPEASSSSSKGLLSTIEIEVLIKMFSKTLMKRTRLF